MSDQSQGPGWWQASDNKWYPPETRPATSPTLPAPAPAGPKRNHWQRFRAEPVWIQIVAWAVLSFFALGLIGAAIGSNNSGKAQKTAAVAPSSTVPSRQQFLVQAEHHQHHDDDDGAGHDDDNRSADHASADHRCADHLGAVCGRDGQPEERAAKAADYLNYTSFSRKSLIDQLGFEGFTPDDAAYGVDALFVDWNDQAAKKAADYLKCTSFSHGGLVDQLVFEGFTQEQAEYGVGTTGL